MTATEQGPDAARRLVRLVPLLSSPLTADFNIFAVMRHGDHEKQLSNIFAWLLDAAGTHGLGDRFQNIFIGAINVALPGAQPVLKGGYVVRQEQNTSASGLSMDIADLVLENHDTRVVVENYGTSDGHGHSFQGYLDYGGRDGHRGVVVMLCEFENRSALTDDWEHSAVVLYDALLNRVVNEIQGDQAYRSTHPDQTTFITHMHRRFAKGRTVTTDHLVELIGTLCQTGNAKHFGANNHDDGARQFAQHLAAEAEQQFKASREVLREIKARLRLYGQSTLMPEINTALGSNQITRVSANYQGNYEWTINLHGVSDIGGVPDLQLKFGPSAWHANTQDKDWKTKIAESEADYTHLYLCRFSLRELRQTSLTMGDVLNGLDDTDTRLRDEALVLLSR